MCADTRGCALLKRDRLAKSLFACLVRARGSGSVRMRSSTAGGQRIIETQVARTRARLFRTLVPREQADDQVGLLTLGEHVQQLSSLRTIDACRSWRFDSMSHPR
eukprot:2369012-Pleurochrysis_carterae.AAC.2